MTLFVANLITYFFVNALFVRLVTSLRTNDVVSNALVAAIGMAGVIFLVIGGLIALFSATMREEFILMRLIALAEFLIFGQSS